MSLKPMPSLSLLRHILFQLIQCALFLSPIDSHQNLEHILFISLQMDLRSLKQHMVQLGIAWVTALIKTYFLPIEKSFSFQTQRVFQTLSLTFQNTLFFLCPVCEDMPRYSPKESVSLTPGCCLAQTLCFYQCFYQSYKKIFHKIYCSTRYRFIFFQNPLDRLTILRCSF